MSTLTKTGRSMAAAPPGNVATWEERRRIRFDPAAYVQLTGKDQYADRVTGEVFDAACFDFEREPDIVSDLFHPDDMAPATPAVPVLSDTIPDNIQNLIQSLEEQHMARNDAEAKTEANAIPRPAKMGKENARNIVENVACPECGFAVTKIRKSGRNFHVCTRNIGENPPCEWFREIDADGNYLVAVGQGDEW